MSSRPTSVATTSAANRKGWTAIASIASPTTLSDLADALGGEIFQVVGHDWGAAVAWWMATRRPSRLRRMVALSAPHPAVWRHAMTRDREQRKKSRYVQMLRLPWLPELLIKAGGYSGLAKAFDTAKRPQAFGPDAWLNINPHGDSRER